MYVRAYVRTYARTHNSSYNWANVSEEIIDDLRFAFQSRKFHLNYKWSWISIFPCSISFARGKSLRTAGNLRILFSNSGIRKRVISTPLFQVSSILRKLTRVSSRLLEGVVQIRRRGLMWLMNAAILFLIFSR